MRMKTIEQILNQYWYDARYPKLKILFFPLACLFRVIIFFRYHYHKQCTQRILSYDAAFVQHCGQTVTHYKACQQKNPALKNEQYRPKIVIIGNLNVGGGGKTPLVIETVNYLKQSSHQPAVLSRTYKANCKGSHLVQSEDRADWVGDEPYLIFQSTGVPVMIDTVRVRGLKKLIQCHPNCDVVVCDDGLQHYALPRDIEIVVYDAKRGFGNKRLLPMGPLREPISRLKSVDFVVCKYYEKKPDNLSSYAYQISLRSWTNLVTGIVKETAAFNTGPYCAIAGIADPDSFYALLEKAGIHFYKKPVTDHARYVPKDFSKIDPILMTAKDAVKCQDFNLKNAWYANIEIRVEPAYFQDLERQLKSI